MPSSWHYPQRSPAGRRKFVRTASDCWCARSRGSLFVINGGRDEGTCMKTVLLLLKVHLKSAFGALRNDTRTKITWFIALGLDCGVGLWSINQLLDHVSQWQAAGSAVLEARLWLLFSGAWLVLDFLHYSRLSRLDLAGISHDL